MDLMNMKSVIPVILGLCMLVMFNLTFNDSTAQPVTTGNLTTGNVAKTTTTTTGATPSNTTTALAPTDNVSTGNSAFDALNAINQTTANDTSPSVTTPELNQTGVRPTPQDQSQVDKTNSNTSSLSSGSELNERLLNYTNNAILALNEDNETEIQQNLVQIQDALIKAIGKPVVIIPAPAFESDRV